MRTFALLFLTWVASAAAQTKPAIKAADFGKWETLGQVVLSPDGKWLACPIRRTDGTYELRVSPTAGGKTHTIAFCSAAAFSAGSRWLACEATVSEAEQDRLRKARRPVQNKLAVLDLAGGAVTTIDDVQSFAFSGDAEYLAFRRYPPSRDGAAQAATPAPAGRGGRGGAAPAARSGGRSAPGRPGAARAAAIECSYHEFIGIRR